MAPLNISGNIHNLIQSRDFEVLFISRQNVFIKRASALSFWSHINNPEGGKNPNVLAFIKSHESVTENIMLEFK